MTWQSSQPQSWPHAPGLTVVEANRGQARTEIVSSWLAEQVLASDRDGACQMLRLRCRPQDAGPWAGLREPFREVVRSLRRKAPELLEHHAQELCQVLPELRSELGFPQSLTDTVPEEEKTRNYAADRAYRCLHGLIDLLSEWHELTNAGPWVIACEDYDEANPLVRRFYAQLLRRRGTRLGLRLMVTVAPGRGEAILAGFADVAPQAAVRLELPAAEEIDRPPAEWTRIAHELDARLRARSRGPRAGVPRLIDAWHRSDTPERALRWELSMMSTHNHVGLYEVGLRYADAVEAGLESLYAESPADYFDAIRVLYFCYVMLDRAPRVRELVEQALERAQGPRAENEFCYLLAMLHARFLKPVDLSAAERLSQRAIDGPRRTRARRGRSPFPDRVHAERTGAGPPAPAPPRGGGRPLQRRRPAAQRAPRLRAPPPAPVGPAVQHRPGARPDRAPTRTAMDYFSQAMAMDPNYSEYYNDRGAVYFKLGRLDEAEADYRRAIELARPTPRSGRTWDSATAKCAGWTRPWPPTPDRSTSSPAPLALVGRAEAHFALGRLDAALADYDRALALEPDRALVLAGRAIVRYESGRLAEAAADLDRAVELDPEVPELYQNRAVALRDLGRLEEAARDLGTYVRLCPDADDRAEIEAQLAAAP